MTWAYTLAVGTAATVFLTSTVDRNRTEGTLALGGWLAPIRNIHEFKAEL